MLKSIFKTMLVIASIGVFYSCSGDDEDSDSLVGWYTDLTQVATTSGFNRINQAIDDNECIYTTGYSHKYDVYAERDIFFSDDGMWYSSNANHGSCRFLPDPGCIINPIHIINDNTIEYHIAYLYDPNYVYDSAKISGKVYAGHNFGVLVYYDDSPRTYTYMKTDNKLIVSNGDIFTITNSGLIKDGSSQVMSKYDPNTEF